MTTILWHSCHQEIESISLLLDSGLGHMTCFGQWEISKCDIRKGFQSDLTFPAFRTQAPHKVQATLLNAGDTWFSHLSKDKTCEWSQLGLTSLSWLPPTNQHTKEPRWDQEKNHLAEPSTNYQAKESWAKNCCFYWLSFGAVFYAPRANWFTHINSFISHVTLWSRFCYYHHFTVEETEVHEGSVICPRSLS